MMFSLVTLASAKVKESDSQMIFTVVSSSEANGECGLTLRNEDTVYQAYQAGFHCYMFLRDEQLRGRMKKATFAIPMTVIYILTGEDKGKLKVAEFHVRTTAR